MFDWRSIPSDSALASEYIQKMGKRFPHLQPEKTLEGVHLCVFDDHDIVGGVTLTSYKSLNNDPDIQSYWVVRQGIMATRMSRLWVSPRKSESVLPHIFHAVLSYVDQEAYLFGILSLPLHYAQKQAEFFKNHEGWLEPRQTLEDCKWDPLLDSSSEGRRLFQTYLRAGARILGPVSGDPHSHSIKLALGMKKDQVIIPQSKVMHA